MEHLPKIVGRSAGAALDALALELGSAQWLVVDLGDGHAPLHVERLPHLEGALLVAHYFEGGSRREGCRATPAPEIVFARGLAGWSPLTLRDAFVEHVGVADAGGLIVEFANAWLSNVQDRLISTTRRAA